MAGRILLAILLLSFTVAFHESAFCRELRVADTHPQDYPTVQALEHFGALLAERSQQRLTLKILHSRIMGEERETVRHVRAGALDMARVNMAVLNDFVPETVVPSLPFVFRSAEHLHHVLDGPVGEQIARAFPHHGMVVLAFYDSGARSFYTTRGPLAAPADLRGLRIRVQQSKVAEAMVRAWGAIPVPLPYGQVGVGLATGVIDGAENNAPAYQDAGHSRSARYYSLSEHTMAPEVLAMSAATWRSLSADERTLVRQAAQDSVPVMRALWAERERAARDAVTAAGTVITTVDKAAFAETMPPLYRRFAGKAAQRDLLLRIQATD